MKRTDMNDTRVMIVEGSTISTPELCKAFRRHGADVLIAQHVEGAFALLKHLKVDAAVIDFTTRESSLSLRARLTQLDVPYILCGAPNRTQRVEVRTVAAENVSLALREVIDGEPGVIAALKNSEHPLDPAIIAIQLPHYGGSRIWPSVPCK